MWLMVLTVQWDIKGHRTVAATYCMLGTAQRALHISLFPRISSCWRTHPSFFTKLHNQIFRFYFSPRHTGAVILHKPALAFINCPLLTFTRRKNNTFTGSNRIPKYLTKKLSRPIQSHKFWHRTYKPAVTSRGVWWHPCISWHLVFTWLDLIDHIPPCP